MAYSTPLTAVSNATLTAAQWNASVRDNILETAPAKSTAAGQIFVSTAANAIAARSPNGDRVDASETTSSTSYVALTTAGPALTVTTGTGALVSFTAQMTNNTAGSATLAYVNVTGASSVSLGDAGSITHEPGSASLDTTCTRSIYYALTAGSNTFTMLYRVTANTGTFARRTMVVIPL